MPRKRGFKSRSVGCVEQAWSTYCTLSLLSRGHRSPAPGLARAVGTPGPRWLGYALGYAGPGATAVRAGTLRQQLRQSSRGRRTPTSTTGRAETAAGARHVRRLGEVRRRGASARGVGRGSAPRRATAASPLACHADPTPTDGGARILGDTTKRSSTPGLRGRQVHRAWPGRADV